MYIRKSKSSAVYSYTSAGMPSLEPWTGRGTEMWGWL